MASANDRKQAGRILSALVFEARVMMNPLLREVWERAIKCSNDGKPFTMPNGVTFSWEKLEEVTSLIHHMANAATIKEVLAAVSGTERQNEARYGKLCDFHRLPLWAAIAEGEAFALSSNRWQAVKKAAKKRQETHGR